MFLCSLKQPREAQHQGEMFREPKWDMSSCPKIRKICKQINNKKQIASLISNLTSLQNSYIFLSGWLNSNIERTEVKKQNK